MDNSLNQVDEAYKDFREETLETTKIKAIAHDSSEKFKKFMTLGVTGAFGAGLLSILPHSPLDNFMPILAVAIAIPAYYGVKAIVTHHMAENAEQNLLNSQKQIAIRIAETRDRFNKNDTLDLALKI